MKIILENNIELNPIIVMGGSHMVRGAVRDVLSFVFPEETSLDELDAIFTAENCKSITIVEDNGDAYVHNGYTVRASLSREPVVVSPETATEPEVVENRAIVSMAQPVYMETQIEEVQSALSILAGREE